MANLEINDSDNDSRKSALDASRLFHEDGSNSTIPDLFGMYDYSVQGIDEVMDGSGIIDYTQPGRFHHFQRHYDDNNGDDVDNSVCSFGEQMRGELLHQRFDGLLDSSEKTDHGDEIELGCQVEDDRSSDQVKLGKADMAPSKPVRPGLVSATANTAEGVWRSMKSLVPASHVNVGLERIEQAPVQHTLKKQSSFKIGARSKSLHSKDDIAPSAPRRGVKKSSSFISNRFERTGIAVAPRRGVKKSSSFIANRFESTEVREPRRGVKKSFSFRFPGKNCTLGSPTDNGYKQEPAEPTRGVTKASSFRFPSRTPVLTTENRKPSRGVRKSSSFRFPAKAVSSIEDVSHHQKRGIKKATSFKLSRLVTPSA